MCRHMQFGLLLFSFKFVIFFSNILFIFTIQMIDQTVSNYANYLITIEELNIINDLNR